MKIAEVIVDVPTLGTDREFDYLVPEKWRGIIEPGMRVAVPFGPRTIQGIVRNLKDNSPVEGLRELKKPLDLTPILNDELLQLGEWLAAQTLSLKISTYHAMLPAAMKSKYEKRLKRLNFNPHPFLDELFQDREEITWITAEEQGVLQQLSKEIKAGNVEVIYSIKNRLGIKKVKHYKIAKSKTEVEDIISSLRANAVSQKRLLQFFLNHMDESFTANELLEQCQVSNGTIKTLVSKGYIEEMEVEIYRDPYAHKTFTKSSPFPLTKEQKTAIQPILNSVENNIHETFLLYGVTGSGKTEIYLQAIQAVLNKGKEAIVLVPEISLTPQMVHRFKSRFGDDVAVLHSALSIGEHFDEWRKIVRKEAKVVVGARSAIFAPFENLGIIIIDEEHESSYKQEEQPRYHARDVAIFRGQYHQCPVVLGSATPSLESFARAQKGVYHLLTLTKRMNEMSLPSVDIVDMREEMRKGNRSIFSVQLLEKLKDRLAKKEQTILFLNKRGHSSFILCRSCGYVVQCPHCDISLTYHRATNEMKCHYCGYQTYVPKNCPNCDSKYIRYFGTGTQKVEEELHRLLPEARVIRMDVDTTSRKGSHERLLEAFKNGQADILLGTQMIAKGLDFPNITLVGVLSADTMLNLPDFRSGEKTFQLLTQVSGRAGRHELIGEVIIQTYNPEHYSIELSKLQDYYQFYKREMIIRKAGSYPPFYYLTLVTVSHEDVTKVISVTNKITRFIQSEISKQSIILGPVASPIPRINNRYRYQCLIKYKREPNLLPALKKILEHYHHLYQKEGLSITIDVNPMNML